MTRSRDLTLVLNRPTAVDPKTEVAVQQFLKIHQLFATMASGQPAPAELSKIAGPAPVKFLNAVLAGDRQAKQRGGGTLTVTVTRAQVSASAAVGMAVSTSRRSSRSAPMAVVS
jgi:hypothetical protein